MGTHSSSKIAIILDASGFVAIWGICRNSARSIEPEPSLEADSVSTTCYIVDSDRPIQLHEPLFQPFKFGLRDCIGIEIIR